MCGNLKLNGVEAWLGLEQAKSQPSETDALAWCRVMNCATAKHNQSNTASLECCEVNVWGNRIGFRAWRRGCRFFNPDQSQNEKPWVACC